MLRAAGATPLSARAGRSLADVDPARPGAPVVLGVGHAVVDAAPAGREGVCASVGHRRPGRRREDEGCKNESGGREDTQVGSTP